MAPAHLGFAFMDGLPDYGRHVLEMLRKPLASGQIMISRAAHQTKFSADFQLTAGPD